MSRKATFSLLVAAAALTSSALAADQTWITTNADNNWNSTTPNWDSGTAWINGNNAVFGGTGETVTINQAGISTGGITFNSANFIINASAPANTLTLTGSATLATTTGVSRIDAVLAGTGRLVKTGAGELVLAGTNTYTGGTTLSAGTVRVLDNSAFGTGVVSVTGNTSIGGVSGQVQNPVVINNDFAISTGTTLTAAIGFTQFTLNGVVSGAGALTVNAGGSVANNLTLNGVNTYTGATTITAGGLIINGTGSLGAGNYAGAIANAGRLTFGTSANQTLSGVISGTGTLTKSGSGTLLLTGANTYTGATTVNAGILRIGNGASGSIVAGSAVTVAGGATVEFNLTGNTTFANPLAGTGTFIFSGANIGAAAGSVSSHSLTGANGGLTSAATITANNARLNIAATTAVGAATLTNTGNGQIWFSTAGTFANNLIISGIGWGEAAGNLGAIRLGNTTLSGIITLAGDSRINAFGTTLATPATISGAIAESGGARGLDFGGSSTASVITLSGTTSYTGATSITNGTLTVTGATGLATTSGVIVNSGSTLALNYSTNNTSKINDTGTTGLVLNGGSTISLTGGTHTEIVGPVTINGSATLNGTAGQSKLALGNFVANGNLNLSAINIATTTKANNAAGFLAGLTIAGTDLARNDGSGNVVAFATYTDVTRLAGGTKVIANNANNVVRLVEGAGAAAPVTIASGTTDINSLFNSVSGGVSAGTVDLTGGTLRLAAAGSITNAVGAGALTIQGGTLTAGGAADTAGVITLANLSTNALTVSSVIANNGIGAVSLVTSGTVTLSAANTFTGGITANGGTLTLNTAGVAFDNPAGSGGGALTINNGATVVIANGWNAGFNRPITVNFGGTLNVSAGTAADGNNYANVINLNGGAVSGNSLRLGFHSNPVITVGGTRASTISAGLLFVDNGASTDNATFNVADVTASSQPDLTVTGVIADLSGLAGLGLLKTGAGTLNLSALNTFTGTTTINDGNVLLSAGGAAGTLRGAVVVNAGATLTGNVSDSLGFAAGTAVTTLTLNGGTFNNAVNSNQGFITNLVLNAGTVTSTGGGLFNFNTGFGISTLAAATESLISGGILMRGNNLTITVADGAAINDLNITGVINNNGGNGALIKNGSGNLVLAGTNTYTGATTVQSGTLTIAGATRSSSSVNVGATSASTLAITAAGNLSTVGVLTLGAGAGGNTVTVAAGGTLSAGGGINNVGQTNYAVDGVLNYTGGSGWLISAANATENITGSATGTITGTTLNISNSAIVNYSALGSLTLTGTLSTGSTTAGHSGAFNQSAGTVQVSGLALGTASSNAAQSYSLTGGRLNLGAAGITLAGFGTRTLTLGAATLGANADWTGSADTVLADAVTGVSINTLDATDGITARTITLSGTISGTGALVKNGEGTLVLSGTNTYSGDTTLNTGTLSLTNILALQNSTLNTGASGAQQTVFAVAGTNTYTFGGLTGGDALGLGANSLVVGGNNASTTYTGNLGGTTGSFTKNGSGTLTLTQALANTGGVTVNNGTLVATGGIASDSLTLGDGVNSGKIALGGAGANITNLVTNGNANAIVGATGAVTSLGLTVASNTTLGATLGGAGLNENNLAVTKNGAGDLVLANAATYTGDTTVSGGKLIVGAAGSLSASNVTVASGATLGVETTGKTFANLTFDDGSFLNIAAANGQTTNAGLITASGTVGVNASFTGTVNVGDNIVLLTGTATAGTGTFALIANPNSRIQGTISAVGNDIVLNVTQAFATLLWNNAAANGIWDLNTSANFANGLANDKFLAADRVQFDDSAAQKTVTLAGALNAGLVTVNNSTGNDYTFTGTGSIGGNEGLLKQGLGTLFIATTNNYTGATVITGGKISVTSLTDGGLNSAIGASTNAAANLVLAGGALEYTGATAASTDRLFTIGNSATGDVLGTILSNGAGTLTFSNTGAIAYADTDTARTLVLGGSNTGDNTFNPLVADNGTGAVSLVKADAGKWILTADNTYSGATTVSAGTLQVGTGGASGAIGTGALDIGAGATVLINRTGTVTLAGAITGSGALTQLATGTLVVTDDGSAYTGTTTLATGGILQIGTTGGTTGSLAGAIVNNGTVVFERDGDLTRAGVISGTGSVVKNGAGTLTVTGANTYAGTTTVNTGTLEIATGGSLGTGNVINDAALLFSHAGNSIVQGVISGTGTLTRSGTGRTILAADNTFTGDTTVNSGTLQLGNGGTTGSIAGALVLAGGNLAFARSGSYEYTGDINGNGGVEIVSGVITLSGTNGYTGATTISGGTLVVTSAASIGSGTIAFGAGGLLKYAPGFADDLSSRFSNQALQRYNVDTNGQDITFASELNSLGGVLTKNGAGTLILTATNSYTNGTRINGGAVRIEGAGTLGSGGVTLNGGDLIVARPGDFAISGIISGAGNLTKEGTGTLVLTGANNFTGTTTINGGTLQVGDGGTTGSLGAGTVINNGTLAFNSSGTVQVGTIQGAGTIAQIGTGTVVISDTAYTGAISATSGRIVMGGTATPTGGIAIASGATLEFHSDSGQNRVVSTASPITGGGNIAFSGAGTTQFTTGLALTGSGQVFSGHTLDLGTDANANFALTGLTVDAFATLRGQGRINGGLVNNGTFRPGNSPGIVAVNGDFTNGAGATLVMEIAGDGGAGAVNGHDQIQYTGTAFLGGTLQLSFTGGFLPTPPTTYTLLLDTDGSSQPATSGSFANIVLPTGVFGRIVTTSSGLDYEVTTSAAGALGNLAVPSSVQSFANAFVGLGNADPFVNAVLAKQSAGNPEGAIRDLVNASPLALGSLTTLAIDQGRNSSEVVRNRLDAMRRSQLPDFLEPQTVQAYAQGTGLYNKTANDYDKATFDHSFVGGKVGLERYVAGDNGLGVNLGYDRGTADAHFGGGRMEQDHSGATVYAGFGLPRDFFLYVGAFGGYSSYETKRNTIAGTNTGDTEGYDIGATVVFGKTFDTWEGVRFTPYAGLTYTHAQVNGFAETGSPLALKLDAYTQDSFRARAGFDLDKAFFDDNDEALRIGIGAVIDQELGDKTVTMRGAFANGASSAFETTSQTLPETTLSFGPYVTFGVGRGKSVRLGYRYQTGFDDSSAHRLDASFTARF